MVDISTLSHSASRLLLGLLLYSDFNDMPKTRQMELCGISKEQTYRTARQELQSKGLVTLTPVPGKQTSLSLCIDCVAVLHTLPHVLSSAGSGVVHGDEMRNGMEHFIGGGGGDSIIYSNIGEGKHEPVEPNHSNGSTLKVVPSEDYPYPEGSTLNGLPPLKVLPLEHDPEVLVVPQEHDPKVPTLVERCREADAMDDSGDIAVRTSPAQKRRKAQIPLIQEAWSTYFPHDNRLLPENAKLFLNLNNDSSLEVVLDIGEVLKKKPELQQEGATPLGYFKARFRGRAAQGEQGVPPKRASGSSMSSAYNGTNAVSVLERPKVGAGAYVPGGDLPPPSPEYLQALQESNAHFERMRQERGWIE